MSNTIAFVADRGDARMRLDRVLVRRITQIARMSRSLAQRWIEAGVVLVDGRPERRPASRVREGAAIEVLLPPTAQRRSTPRPEAIPLEVLFEDDALIAINKPPGVVVHPSYKQVAGTLLNAVLGRLGERTESRPGIFTRLDKDTSGVVVVALGPAVHAQLQRDAAAGHIHKEYLALVDGVPRPARGRIADPLARDARDRRRVVVSPGGAESITLYEVLATRRVGERSVSLVRCELVTGRTHQIRVHLTARGSPVLGDRLYGTPADAIARQALHAWRIALPHPVTREPLVITAPIPGDMRAAFPASLARGWTVAR